MTTVIWRLHRNQAFFALGALAMVTVILLVTGTTMAHDYHAFFSTCRATASCSDTGQLFSGDGAIIDAVNFTVVVPLLFGLFWGAPLVAKEFEDGTHNLVWTQGLTRRRWFVTTTGYALAAAALWGGAMTVLVSWWRFPENALGSRFDAFDIQGMAPVAYSLFAVALGITVGAVVRRVLPALATTLGVFAAVRVGVGVYLRPHWLGPLTAVIPYGGPSGGVPAGAWVLNSAVVGPGGRNLGNSLTPVDLPAACHAGAALDKGSILPCLATHGFHQAVLYQPASRFWTFQVMESALFVVLAIALLGLAYRMVLSRDA